MKNSTILERFYRADSLMTYWIFDMFPWIFEILALTYGPGRYIFSVVNICIELSLYAVAVRFLDYRFFLL